MIFIQSTLNQNLNQNGNENQNVIPSRNPSPNLSPNPISNSIPIPINKRKIDNWKEMNIEELKLNPEKKIAEAQFELRKRFAEGNGVEINDKEAVKYFQLAADQGNIDAYHSLSGCYASGRGVEANTVMAFLMLKKANDLTKTEKDKSIIVDLLNKNRSK